jgi:hypothetical protein
VPANPLQKLSLSAPLATRDCVECAGFVPTTKFFQALCSASQHRGGDAARDKSDAMQLRSTQERKDRVATPLDMNITAARDLTVMRKATRGELFFDYRRQMLLGGPATTGASLITCKLQCSMDSRRGKGGSYTGGARCNYRATAARCKLSFCTLTRNQRAVCGEGRQRPSRRGIVNSRLNPGARLIWGSGRSHTCMKPIFLSYARIDNDKDDQDEKQGWVAYVHSRLRLALSPKLGKRVDFWRDVQEIKKGMTWHEEIKSALSEARVLLAVMSPSFFESENCRFELQHFLDCHKTYDSTRLAESVIKIFKHHVDSKALPAAIREPEAYQLFVNDPVKGELSYYHPSTGLRADRQQEFMDELERLANRLASLLRESGQAAIGPPSSTVFLAVPYSGSAVVEIYQRIKAELERRTIAVIPDRKRFFSELDEPDPILVDQAVTNARLAVHLLDPLASDEALKLDTRQVDATDRRASDANRLRRLIWVKSKPTGAADNALVSALRRNHKSGGRLFESDKLVEDSSERFVELLLRTLLPEDDTNATGICYLRIDRDDEASARQLALDALATRGLRARLPLPAQLADADRVAIYWGVKGVDWIFTELNKLGTTRPIVLIKGPPATAEKNAFHTDEICDTIDLTLQRGAIP